MLLTRMSIPARFHLQRVLQIVFTMSSKPPTCIARGWALGREIPGTIVLSEAEDLLISPAGEGVDDDQI